MTCSDKIFWALCVAVTACGGAQKGKTTPTGDCPKTADALVAQAPVCSPTLIANFEQKVDQWIQTCGTDAPFNDRIYRALSDSKVCAKNQVQLNARGAQCQSKVQQITNQKNCEVAQCRALLDTLQEVAAECHPFKDNGFDLQTASALLLEITRRIETGKLAAEVAEFRKSCTNALSFIQSFKIQEALNILISAAASQPNLSTDRDETIRLQGAESVALCEGALRTAVDAHFKDLSNRLKDKKVEQDVLVWTAAYRNLSETSLRLKAAGALRIAPTLTAEIDKFLLEIDKRRIEIESEEMGERDSVSKKTLTEAAKQCTYITARIAHLKSKVAEHHAAFNEKKAKAYAAKLAQMETALDTLVLRIDTAARFKPLSDEKIAALLTAARGAGCPIP